MGFLPNDKSFDRRWMHEHTADVNVSAVRNMNAIREFAFEFFDTLDYDGNGFIERNELEDALENLEMSNRQKSFVQFLLNNQKQISEMVEELDSSGQPAEGISRADLEKYFYVLSETL